MCDLVSESFYVRQTQGERVIRSSKNRKIFPLIGILRMEEDGYQFERDSENSPGGGGAKGARGL